MRYISAEQRSKDDFDVPFSFEKGEIVYDAVTRHGHMWATMTEESFRKHGLGKLGTGKGQKYERRELDELHKIEG